DQLDLAARGALERLVRRNPECVHRFRRVVRRLLPLRRKRDEEARIEAPRAAGRRHPVADVAELTRREVEVVLLEQLDEWPVAVAREPPRALGRDELAVRVAREQNAGLLVAL